MKMVPLGALPLSYMWVNVLGHVPHICGTWPNTQYSTVLPQYFGERLLALWNSGENVSSIIRTWLENYIVLRFAAGYLDGSKIVAYNLTIGKECLNTAEIAEYMKQCLKGEKWENFSSLYLSLMSAVLDPLVFLLYLLILPTTQQLF